MKYLFRLYYIFRVFKVSIIFFSYLSTGSKNKRSSIKRDYGDPNGFFSWTNSNAVTTKVLVCIQELYARSVCRERTLS